MTLSKLEKRITKRNDPLARRYRKLVRALTALLSDGEPNEAETSVIKVAALITLECEQMTTRYLNGEEVSRTDIVRMANAATRLLEAIGVEKAKRAPADPNKALTDLLRDMAQKKARKESNDD